MDQRPPLSHATILRLAHRKGAFAFGLAAGLQVLGIVVVTLLTLPMIYLLLIAHTSEDEGFLRFLDGVEWVHLSIGYAGGAIPYLLLSIGVGSVAGKKILIQGGHFASTGILYMQFPGIFAAIFGIWISSIDLLGNPFFEGNRYPVMLWGAMIYCPLAFYLPTFCIGILAGLMTRQFGQQAIAELRAQQGD
jgi:hypothetical protein